METILKKILILLLFVLSISQTGAATSFTDIFKGVVNRSETSTSVHNQTREAFPVVTLREKLKPIVLDTLNVTVKISGPIARTTYEMLFCNPNSRILEGELKLPLLDGQRVVGYALDIDGVYRESVAVEKAKAKKAYESVVRQAVDPGIIEKAAGNNYKLRLYPLPAEGTKKVKITVEEILYTKADRYRYQLPFVSNRKIPHFSLHIEIAAADLPVVELSGPIESRDFEHSEQGYYYDYQKSEIRLNKPLLLSIEKRDSTDIYFQKGPRNHNWFMTIIPKVQEPQEANLPDKASETLEIIWDTSLSAEKRNRAEELAFLDRFFTSHRGTVYTVRLKTIDLQSHTIGSFEVRDGNWVRLKAALENLRYDGAKDLSKLTIDRGVERVFLFSNGINSFSDTVALKKQIPIITIASSAGADTDTLRYIAYRTGGRFLDLSQLSLDDAIQKMERDDRLRIVKQSRAIDDTYIRELGEDIVILGRIRGKKGWIDYRQGDEKHRITIKNGAQSSLLARVWANQKIENLSLRYHRNKKQIIALARKYRVVTRYTSLIVLDRVEDYVRYEIVPPRSLQKRYYALLKKKKREKRSKKKREIEEAIALLKEQKQWYRTKFPLSKKAVEEEEEASGMGGDIAPVEEPMAAPAPATLSQKASVRKKKSKKAAPEPRIILKAWQSDAAYLQGLDAIPKKKLFDRYFELRKAHREVPAFYIDMADYFRKRGLKRESLLILSNLLELDFDNSELIRVFAFKLQEYHQNKTSIYFFRKVRELRPFEPQSTRDLALAYERSGKYQRALDLHYSIIVHSWDGRFRGTKIVTINEMNHLIIKHRLNTSRIDRRLIARMPVDIRIVINWSTDNTDMDLWVIDPEGVKTYYGNRISRNGGKISNDMTQGYGPEEFMLKKAIRGPYAIKVKYYGSSQQKLTGPTVIRAEVYTKYGYRKEKREDIIFRVEEEKEVIDLGEITY